MDRRIRLNLPGPGNYGEKPPEHQQNQFGASIYGDHQSALKRMRETGTAPPPNLNPFTALHGKSNQPEVVQRKKMHVCKPVDETLSPCQTIYVNNLNEKIRHDELKKALTAVFKQFGTIVEIVAMKSMRRKGQAYISFTKLDEAVQAQKAMQGFPLFQKPLRIEFARKNSDKVSKLIGEYKPRPPRPPRPTKNQRRMLHARKEAEKAAKLHEERMSNPLTAPQQPIFQFGDAPPPPPPDQNNPYAQQAYNDGYAPPPPPPTANMNTPPNNILFIERLPPESNELMISVLFNQFAGYKEVRLVPGRTDIAFVEFETIEQATIAKSQLHNFKVTPTHAMKVTFAKQ